MNPDPDFFPLILYPKWVSDTIAIGELEGANQARLDFKSEESPGFGNDPNSKGLVIGGYQRLIILIDGLK
tara:strand:+ start:296 stop:505 length:210 start_codon:yes stop_codon:yes gene_type:complete